jgi:hypothetical protein
VDDGVVAIAVVDDGSTRFYIIGIVMLEIVVVVVDDVTVDVVVVDDGSTRLYNFDITMWVTAIKGAVRGRRWRQVR